MKHTSVYIEKSARNESIFVLHMNRGKKLNALNNTLVNELHECIDHIQNDPHARALIIRSESENAFCAGIDTSYVKTLSNEEVAQFMVSIASLLEKISALPIVTIAAVRGYAYGAGADIALA